MADVEVTQVRYCGICRGEQLKLILDLGEQPLAERETGGVYPLALMECTTCGLVQLSHIVDPAQMFPCDHPYATGNTRFLREHFAKLAVILTPRVSSGDLIVDIGANDGTFLDAFRHVNRDARLLAIEPTGQAAACRAKVIPVEQEFFTAALARKIARYIGEAKVIVATNVLAHVPDPHDFLSGVSSLLADDGVFVTENHDWASVVNGLQVDTIYHEHLRYYSISSLGYLLAMHGFLISGAEPIAAHGGSFRISAVRQHRAFGARAGRARDELRELMEASAASGPVYGIGASTRATPLIHYTGIAPHLSKVCEVASSAKIGTCIPGTSIPIVDEKALIEDQPPHALLLSWHLKDHLVPKLRADGYEGRFIVPLPKPKVIYG
jgi:hypothetical protein